MRKLILMGNRVVSKEDGRADEVVRRIDGRQQAFAAIVVKDFDDSKRTFKGVATTATPDRKDDIVDPKGAIFSLPIPFVYQHDSGQPIGWIDKAKLVGDQWQVEGRVATPEPNAPQTIVERLNTAWYELKTKLVRGLSIGFNPKEYSFIKETGGIHFLKWEWLELSMVTIPANAEATITNIKSFAQRAALGPTANTQLARAGATPRSSKMKYTHEQLAALRNDRETKAARMAELHEVKSAAGSFTEEQRQEFDALDEAIGNLDDDIRVCQRHVSNIAVAKAVDATPTRSGAPYGFVKKRNDVEPRFKGEEGLKRAVAHIVSMKAMKEGRLLSPLQAFEERGWHHTNPTLHAIMKAAVAGAGPDSGEWGAELVAVDNRYTGDFTEYLYGRTVFDQLPLRNVPANVSIKGQDGAWTGYWIGANKAIKVSKGDFMATSTTPYKAAGLTVVGNEWLQDSSPDGLALVGDGLRRAVAQAVDVKFLSADAVSAGVSPAGILNGVSAITSAGNTADDVQEDIIDLFAPFITAKDTGDGFAWITTPTTALQLSMMRNALGQSEYPGITPQGGTFAGYPVFVGDNVGAADLILIKPSDIWRIGDSGVELAVSDSAMIEQDDAPTGATDTPTAATASITSMFQEYSTAIRVVRRISWGKRRSHAVQYVGNATYGPSAT